MTSRDRVLAAFAFDEPDRVPAWFGASPEFMEKAKLRFLMDDEQLREFFGDDFRVVRATCADPKMEQKEDGVDHRTAFGVERTGIGYGQPVSHPLSSASLTDILDYPWPEPAWNDVSHIQSQAKKYHDKYAVMSGDWSPFWHDAIDLLGMEKFMLTMYEAPDVVDTLLTKIVDYYYETSRLIFDAAGSEIDIFFFGSDFGTQQGPMISEALFRRFIQPQLARLAGLGHDYGLKVMLHCCGGIVELLPAMIEAGIDAIHAIQPCCHGMDLRLLKREFGSRIVFNGAIDSHHILLDGSPDSVRHETERVLDIMMPGGGYIAGASHDYILGETPVENIDAMFDTIQNYGVYSRLTR